MPSEHAHTTLRSVRKPQHWYKLQRHKRTLRSRARQQTCDWGKFWRNYTSCRGCTHRIHRTCALMRVEYRFFGQTALCAVCSVSMVGLRRFHTNHTISQLPLVTATVSCDSSEWYVFFGHVRRLIVIRLRFSRAATHKTCDNCLIVCVFWLHAQVWHNFWRNAQNKKRAAEASTCTQHGEHQ